MTYDLSTCMPQIETLPSAGFDCVPCDSVVSTHTDDANPINFISYSSGSGCCPDLGPIDNNEERAMCTYYSESDSTITSATCYTGPAGSGVAAYAESANNNGGTGVTASCRTCTTSELSSATINDNDLNRSAIKYTAKLFNTLTHNLTEDQVSKYVDADNSSITCSTNTSVPVRHLLDDVSFVCPGARFSRCMNCYVKTWDPAEDSSGIFYPLFIGPVPRSPFATMALYMENCIDLKQSFTNEIIASVKLFKDIWVLLTANKCSGGTRFHTIADLDYVWNFPDSPGDLRSAKYLKKAAFKEEQRCLKVLQHDFCPEV